MVRWNRRDSHQPRGHLLIRTYACSVVTQAETSTGNLVASKGFPFGEDAIGTNLYAWCANSPVTRVDPSGMWSFRDLLAAAGRAIGGSAGAAIGGAIGGLIDYGIGYVSGYAGWSGSSGSYSGGGYGFSGNTAGRKAAQAVAKPKVNLKPTAAFKSPAASSSAGSNYNFKYLVREQGFGTAWCLPKDVRTVQADEFWNQQPSSQQYIYDQYKKKGYVTDSRDTPLLFEHIDWNSYRNYEKRDKTQWVLSCYASISQSMLELGSNAETDGEVASCYFESMGVPNYEPFKYYDFNPVPTY